MPKLQRMGMQPELLDVEKLTKQSIVFSVAIDRVAHDWVPGPGKMASDLMHAPGERVGEHERVAAGRESFVPPGKFRQSDPSNFSGRFARILEGSIQAKRFG